MAAQLYLSYTAFLYDWSMGLWYQGESTKNPVLVNASTDLWHRSQRAAVHEGVAHPEDPEAYDEIPF